MFLVAISENSRMKFYAEVHGPRAHVTKDSKSSKLYDHRPLVLDNDNYQRILQIPKRKVG